jgi:hypothetical protein
MQLLLDLPLDAISWVFTSPRMTILAYLDPGTGSYALQILLATLFGGMFALKQSWAELKLWLSSRFGDSHSSSEPNTTRPATGVRPNDLARPGVHGHSTAKIQ